MPQNPKTWGYILEGPRRPDREKQLEILGVHNIDMDEFGPVWSDKIIRGKRGPGSGQKQLLGRNDLLLAVQPGDRVIVSDAFCLGVSPDDVAWFIGALAERKVSLLVSGASHHVAPGQDASDLIEEVARRQNAANVAACRARQLKRKHKST